MTELLDPSANQEVGPGVCAWGLCDSSSFLILRWTGVNWLRVNIQAFCCLPGEVPVGTKRRCCSDGINKTVSMLDHGGSDWMGGQVLSASFKFSPNTEGAFLEAQIGTSC